MELTRRKFLSKTATAVVVAGAMAQGKVFGANNRIRVCTVGFNGQGSSHIKDILSMKDEAEYTALCDVDSQVLARGHTARGGEARSLTASVVRRSNPAFSVP